MDITSIGSHASTTVSNSPLYSQIGVFPPIMKLPDDILGSLFTLLSSMDRTSERNNDNRTTDAWFYRNRAAPLSRVCRKWREVALDLPLLWNFISMPRYKAEQVKQYLLRSKSTPLHLFVDSENPVYDRILDIQLDLAEKHISRVATFGMRSRHLSKYIGRLPFSIDHAPLLRELILESTNTELRPIPICLSSSRLSVLQALHLRGAYPIPGQVSLKSLKRLVLHWNFLDMQEFIAIVAGCSESLEELEIHGLCTRASITDNSYAPKTVPLKRLRKLVLQRNFCPLPHLLWHLDIPSNIYWEIVLDRDPLNDPGLHRILHELLPAPFIHNNFHIKLNKTFLSVESYSSDFPSDQEHQRLEMWDSRCGSFADTFLREVGTIIPSTITYLNIDFRTIGDHPIHSSTLLTILSRLTALRTLVIGQNGEDAHLRSIQMDLVRALSTKLASISNAGRQRLCCPELTRLEIAGFDFLENRQGNIARELAMCLRERVNSGYGLLHVHINQALNMNEGMMNTIRVAVERLYVDEVKKSDRCMV